jgi:hypothetical protein
MILLSESWQLAFPVAAAADISIKADISVKGNKVLVLNLVKSFSIFFGFPIHSSVTKNAIDK